MYQGSLPARRPQYADGYSLQQHQRVIVIGEACMWTTSADVNTVQCSWLVQGVHQLAGAEGAAVARAGGKSTHPVSSELTPYLLY